MPRRVAMNMRSRLLPLLYVGGLLTAATLGWLVGHLSSAVAIVATIQVLWLLRRASRAAPAPAPSIQQLSAELHDMRQAAQSMGEALVVIDGSAQVRWFNHAAQQLLGLAHPDDSGGRVDELFADTALGEWLADPARADGRIVAAPGKATAQLSVALIRYGAAGHLLVARDVSAMVRLEQVRRDFVANVSHELRTPLTVIHGYLELIDGGDAPGLAPILVELRAQSMRMEQLVADLLTLSRLETEKTAAQDLVDMEILLAELYKEALVLSDGRHHISLDNRAPGVNLRGSSRDLHSAFSNLISNAIRYTPADGRIVIRWQRSATGASFSVLDSGHGISKQHIARLTERFYRVSSSRSRDSGGTGLGLSIVKHALGLHDARLRISSQPGKGSAFTCVFPLQRTLTDDDRAAG